MVAVKTLRKRGANIVVQANGEALFAPGTDMWKWKNFLTAKVQRATQAAAPTNRRPWWGHYGKPLKATIIADTRTRLVRGGGFFYMIVGSTAPHAYYVDQGTGVYAGRGPYEAAVLPPYTRGGPNLYERTWSPGGPDNPRVKPVFIKGQKPQGFFDTGLRNGFRAMRMRSFQVPGEGASAMSSALKSIPVGMENFLGNTRPDAGFKNSLDEWRQWRDTAYNAGKELGTRGGVQYGRSASRGTRASRARGGPGTKYRTRRTEAENTQRREKAAARAQRYRDNQNASKKQSSATRRKENQVAFAERSRVERKRFLAAARQKGTIIPGSIKFVNGRWTATVYVKGARGISRPTKIQGAVVI